MSRRGDLDKFGRKLEVGKIIAYACSHGHTGVQRVGIIREISFHENYPFTKIKVQGYSEQRRYEDGKVVEEWLALDKPGVVNDPGKCLVLPPEIVPTEVLRLYA